MPLFNSIKNHNDVISSLIIYEELLEKIGNIIADAIINGNKLLIMGNGGSTADSQHFAAELVGRFRKSRKGYPAIALTADSSVMTSISNDSSFSEIFARQIQSYAVKGDILVGISTSGNSENIICTLINMLDHSITVKHSDTQRIQEAHIFIIHLLCGIIEDKIS